MQRKNIYIFSNPGIDFSVLFFVCASPVCTVAKGGAIDDLSTPSVVRGKYECQSWGRGWHREEVFIVAVNSAKGKKIFESLNP